MLWVQALMVIGASWRLRVRDGVGLKGRYCCMAPTRELGPDPTKIMDLVAGNRKWSFSLFDISLRSCGSGRILTTSSVADDSAGTGDLGRRTKRVVWLLGLVSCNTLVTGSSSYCWRLNEAETAPYLLLFDLQIVCFSAIIRSVVGDSK